MNQLVIAPLQKGGIDRHHGLGALAGQTGRKGHGMLFSNPDIEIAPWKLPFKFDQATALTHRGRDANQTRVSGCHVTQPAAEHLRK